MLGIVKHKIDAVVKNLYFKLSVNNITFFMLEKFFLEKIDNNIKVNIYFLYFLIQEAISIKIVNTTNYDNNISVTTFSIANSKKNLYFYNS